MTVGRRNFTAAAVCLVCLVAATLLVGGCNDDGERILGEDAAAPRTVTYEVHNTFDSGAACNDAAEAIVMTDRAAAATSVDLDADGSLDVVSLGTSVYFRSGGLDQDWVSVDRDRDGDVYVFATATSLGRRLGELLILDEQFAGLQRREAQGLENPGTIPGTGIEVSWVTDDDGVVASFDYANTGVTSDVEPGRYVRQQVSVVSRSTRSAEIEAPVGFRPLREEPAAAFFYSSFAVDPACGMVSASEAGASRACVEAALEGATVSEWVAARPGAASYQLGCT